MKNVLPFRLRSESELLALIPSLPRPVLARLTNRLIDRMDELDGDPDLEDSETGSGWIDARGHWCGPGPVPDGPWYEDDEAEEDRCTAGDDSITSLPSPGHGGGDGIGDDVDAEDDGAGDRLPHRRRIQRTRCLPRIEHTWNGRRVVRGYDLSAKPVVPCLRTWRRRDPRLRPKGRRR